MVTEPRSKAWATKMLGNPCLAPLHGDGEETAKVRSDIEAWLLNKPEEVSVEDWEKRVRDKFPRWREKLKKARYLDWQAAKLQKWDDR